MPSLISQNDVAILHLGDTENRLHPDWLAEVNALLTQVEQAPPRALVTTATGKIWCNGLDTDWLGAHPDQLTAYVASAQQLFARLLRLPTATVAAISGHTFGAGAMIALAHDARVMRVDRGFFCLPEVDIGMPFTAGMSLLLQSKLPVLTSHEAMTSGRRYGGAQALEAGIVTAAVPETEVLAAALEIAQQRGGKNGEVLRAVRESMYAPVLAALVS